MPSVSSVANEWDPTNNKYVLRVKGSDISGALDGTDYLINGLRQKAIGMSATEALFHVTDITDSTITNQFILWEMGIGKGNELLGDMTLDPKFVSVSPKKGSAAGSLITLNVEGVGIFTEGLEVLNAGGTSVCESVTITAYATVRCKTRSEEIPSGTALSIKIADKTYTCANTNAVEC